MSEPIFLIEIESEFKGKKNLNLHCTLNGVVIGLISFSEFLCEISIQYMTVNEAFRRQGYARSMLLFLQDSYPENEIFFGQLTDDGAALVASMSKKITPSRYAGDFTMI